MVAAINSGRLTRAAGGARPTFHTVAEMRRILQEEGLEIVARPTNGSCAAPPGYRLLNKAGMMPLIRRLTG